MSTHTNIVSLFAQAETSTRVPLPLTPSSPGLQSRPFHVPEYPAKPWATAHFCFQAELTTSCPAPTRLGEFLFSTVLQECSRKGDSHRLKNNFYPHPRPLLLEREEGREKEREIHIDGSVAFSYAPQQGSKPQPGHVP